MVERILFLTGGLAEKRLNKVLEAMAPTDFTYRTHQVGVKVAALMTATIIMRRLPGVAGFDKVMVPGRFQGNLEALGRHYGVPFERGPDDLTDLPAFIGHEALKPDLSQHDVRIFAEIVDAPKMDVAAIVAQARLFAADGADVIDIGGLPDVPFPHLEEAVEALIQAGFAVSIDSADVDELKRGARAGAGTMLSLNESTLSVADDTDAIPVLIPSPHDDLDSLCRAIDKFAARGRPFIADPILDPIHFGFTDSVMRYYELRRRFPDVDILMGIANLTELTDADTTGVTALIMGVISELRINNVLVVQVSPHARRAVREADVARRIMYAARESASLPVGIHPGLMGLRDRSPFPATPEEIVDMAAKITDSNFRIEISEDGIHVSNRAGHLLGEDPFKLFPHLKVKDDGAHAFYLGVELARAQIAWQLGKRYVQDEPLNWGCAVDEVTRDRLTFKAAGSTLSKRRKRKSKEKWK
jgi:dihydropteroate synthase-like protein